MYIWLLHSVMFTNTSACVKAFRNKTNFPATHIYMPNLLQIMRLETGAKDILTFTCPKGFSRDIYKPEGTAYIRACYKHSKLEGQVKI